MENRNTPEHPQNKPWKLAKGRWRNAVTSINENNLSAWFLQVLIKTTVRINLQCPKAPVKLVNLSSFKVHVRRERKLLYRFWEFVQTSFSVVGNTFLPATIQIRLCVNFCDLASGAIASLAIITFKLGKVTDFKVFFPAVLTPRLPLSPFQLSR